jgi:hypothetical protein
MPPRHPSVSAQQAASRASGNRCPQLSLLPLRRTTHSAWAIATMRRRLRLRSKPLARKAISSSTLLLSQCPMKLVPPRARTPRALASPSRNNCDWNLNIPSVVCARIISCLSPFPSSPYIYFPSRSTVRCYVLPTSPDLRYLVEVAQDVLQPFQYLP